MGAITMQASGPRVAGLAAELGFSSGFLGFRVGSVRMGDESGSKGPE